MERNILIFLLVGTLAGCGKEPAPAARIERPALTLVAGSAAGDVASTYSGEIRARHETQPGFRTVQETLEAAIATLQAKLDDPGLFARDRKVFDETSAALAKAQADLSAAEEKWLALEMLREEIENAQG